MARTLHLGVVVSFQHLIQGGGPGHHQGGPEDGVQETGQVRGAGAGQTRARGHREQDHDGEPRSGQFHIIGPARANEGRRAGIDGERTPGVIVRSP